MFLELLQDLQLFTVLPATFMIICALLFLKNTKSSDSLSNEVKERRIGVFKSEPLIDYSKIDNTFKETLIPSGNVAGCLNLVAVNYINLLNNKDLRYEAEKSIKKYGVGSCGPRGFYGTVDIHLALEDRLAEFMRMEKAVLFSYGFSTISSAISAYCKKSDIIFCDERISFPASQGILAAKSKVVYFKHNDTDDLEDMLKDYEKKETHNKKLFRKFLIVEGIYKSTGKLCPLPKLMELREKYKLRIFIDESISFGVLGNTGRGITEHFNIDRSDVDMIMASMEGAMGSVAGFCVGSAFIIDHQLLSAIGYVFSASQPPFLSHTSICTLDLFENNPNLFKDLHAISTTVDKALNSIPNCVVVSDPLSPLKVITTKIVENHFEKMKKIYDKCIEKNVLILLSENYLQFNVNITMSQHDVEKLTATLQNAFNEFSIGS